MTWPMKWLVLAALVLLAAGNVHAAAAREEHQGVYARPDDAPTASQIAACVPDAQRLCLRHFGDRAALRACMIEHKNQLSETCRATFR
jgi:hypothetical protein